FHSLPPEAEQAPFPFRLIRDFCFSYQFTSKFLCGYYWHLHSLLFRLDYIENIVSNFNDIDFYWHSLDNPRKGIAYCGITLIPPSSMQAFISVIENYSELSELNILLQKAYSDNKWVIHYGL
ncbi:hypothetical protein, partial [Huintestinicola sp.]